MTQLNKARLNVHQLNFKQTEAELKQLQDINNKLFDGKLNKSDLARFLVKVALNTLETAKVETKQVLTINGKVID
jgi:hypothetical protein